jgi:2-polyprenyl-3-methyl-5-hydroxy-6-metoxy-1,4-benzoquinol methylase
MLPVDERLHQLHAELEDTYWWFVAKNRILASLITRFAPQRSTRPRLLDIGCGAGGLMRLLAPRFEVIGVDSSPLARAAAHKSGLKVRDGTLPDRLPFPETSDDRFDVVVMSEVLEHVEADRASVEAAVSLLAPSGLLVCTAPAHPWMWSEHDVLNHHVRRYTRRAFAALFDGLPLSQLVLSPANTVMFPPIALVRLVRGRGPKPGGSNPAGATDLHPLPKPVNALLTAVFAAERYGLPHFRLPFGSSLISVHRRDPEAPAGPG